MSLEKVRTYFKSEGMNHLIREFPTSSATVVLAAKALECEERRIAKTLSFQVDKKSILIVTAGDAKVDNGKYKAFFGVKAKMIPPSETKARIGFDIGGICPFAVNDGVSIYLDVSLQRFDTVFPACGSSNSAIELTISQLEHHAKPIDWIDVCKGWLDENNDYNLRMEENPYESNI
ncbi:YbaK/EbsC family protein [Alkalibacter rhizosphaerae]|uniref:YbaK/EbsC family protein n=1 Tax=Alkalibacter rhizosphaerae TaxID=2815577 RepID=A0A975AI87_9FIRM|nr:YbaK/EbsC family protein [Alkalibacter rhizosphaerae]QSX08424.1 YbaK/EbsC family protein [Alkalibacter rhizosphaerae]